MFSRKHQLLILSRSSELMEDVASAAHKHFNRSTLTSYAGFSLDAVLPHDFVPDIILADCRSNLSEVVQLVKRLREARRYQLIPVLYMVDVVDAKLQAALTLLGTDFLLLPLNADSLAARVNTMLRWRDAHRRLDQQNRALTYLAAYDDLTGLYNRRFVMSSLEAELKKHAEKSMGVAVFLIDLDNFKEVNDTHGHLAGDRLLNDFANLLKSCLRSVDLVGRYGGDEFCIVKPQATPELCATMANRLVECIRDQNFGPSDDRDLKVTASIGVAFSVPDSDISAQKLIALADKALYQCKNKGRNTYAIQQLDQVVMGECG